MREYRSDNDSWEITSGVGATALGMAVARAQESAREHPLFVDTCARIFIDEAIEAGWDPLPGATTRQTTAPAADPSEDARRGALLNYAACRTAYFDQFFTRATADGIRQVIVLGAGLDSRPWRLPWAPGTVVYEVDQPQVLEFKINTLWAHNVDPACEHRPVPVDLRFNWLEALRQNGFDEGEPTAWSAEGLLSYLSQTTRQQLFERIHDHSAPDSRIAIETASPKTAIRRARSTVPETRAAAATAGTTTLRDIKALWYPDRGDDFAEWLSRKGWQVTATEAQDLMANSHRAPDAETKESIPRSAFVEGLRSG
jgi:methyltransferase (TIGR00027 family)